VRDYLDRVGTESGAIPATLTAFETKLADVRERFDALAAAGSKRTDLDTKQKQAPADAVAEPREAETPYETDRGKLLGQIKAYDKAGAHASRQSGEIRNPDNEAQHATRRVFDPIADAIRGLIKQVDLLYKLTARVADLGTELGASGTPSPSRGSAEVGGCLSIGAPRPGYASSSTRSARPPSSS